MDANRIVVTLILMGASFALGFVLAAVLAVSAEGQRRMGDGD